MYKTASDVLRSINNRHYTGDYSDTTDFSKSQPHHMIRANINISSKKKTVPHLYNQILLSIKAEENRNKPRPPFNSLIQTLNRVHPKQ